MYYLERIPWENLTPVINFPDECLSLHQVAWAVISKIAQNCVSVEQLHTERIEYAFITKRM